jgi:transposase-like protein
MPRKKREIPLRRHYSDDLKTRVIYQAFTLGKKSTEIAIDLEMPLRVVQRVKHTWMQTGRVSRSRTFMGRHPLLSPEQSKVLFYVFLLKLCNSHDTLLIPVHACTD